MEVFIEVLDIQPLLNSKAKLKEIGTDTLTECKKAEFQCAFEKNSENNPKKEKKSSFSADRFPTDTDGIVYFSENGISKPLKLPDFSNSGDCIPQKPENIEKVVECFSDCYKKYVFGVSNPKRKIERLGTSLLIHAFFKRRYSCAPPELSKDESGKPYFADFPIEISISHTDGLVCCAFAESKTEKFSLGLDLEKLPSIEKYRSLKRISDRFFPSDSLEGLSESDFCDAFTLLWTKKESLVKMTGKGICEIKSDFPTDTLQKSFRIITEESEGKYYLSLSCAPH